MKLARVIFLFAATGGILTPPGGSGAATPLPAGVATYEVRGVLRSVDPVRRQATIAHDQIPGYMPAMTMSFDVRDPASLTALRPGDWVSFHLCVTATSAWIDEIRPTGQAAAATGFAPAPPSELSVGEFLPDIEFADPQGRQLHLRDYRGQAVAITFVYSRCPLPTYCPLMNRNFQVAQDILNRLEAGDGWHFFSVSLDAAHDTPAVLAAFADGYDADARHWTFVSAPADQVRDFGRAVGLQFAVVQGQLNHNLRTVVLDAAGRIRKIYRGNTWTPQELAAEIRAALPDNPGTAKPRM